MPRAYVQKRRAESREATRQRIVDTTIAMHGERGDDQTTIAEIARRAGISRLTVYRHFPDERSLLAACTGHYFNQHPPPDPAKWRSVADPETRLEYALRAEYAWFDETRVMMARAAEDAPTNPILAELTAPLVNRWDTIRDELVAGWPGESGLRRAAIGHALQFLTWRSLRAQGLTNSDAVALMLGAVRSTGPSRSWR